MVDATLAQVSNVGVYSAMVVYTLALVSFALDLAGAARPARRAAAHVSVPVAAGTSVSVGTAVSAGTSVWAGTSVSAGASGAEPVATDGGAPPGPRRRQAAAVGVTLTGLAVVLHAAAVAARGLSAHRVPWGNMYEFAVTGSAVVAAVFLVVRARPGPGRDLRYLGAFVVGPVLLTLGLAVAVLYTESAQLVPALQSVWLVIHVSVAFVSSALFTIAFSATVLQLVQDRREQLRRAGRPPRRGRWMDAVPPAAELEHSAFRLTAVAFVLWTFTLVAGAIWAEAAWGRYWGWDPKEVWTFVIWVVYAGYLHARATRGWDGRRAAYLALAGYGCILFNFLVVNLVFVGRHSYAGVG